jgi:O-antigen/teichoic acid export membrane protein
MQRDSTTLRRRAIFTTTIGVIGHGFLWLFGFKLVATWLGPEGVGLFSQIRQIIQGVTIGATYGGSSTVVQGLSASSGETARRNFRKTALELIGFTGLLIVVFFVFTVPLLVQFFFASNAADYIQAMYWVALAIALSIASTYVLAILNGYRLYYRLALAQISGPFALSALLLVYWTQGFAFDPVLLAKCFVLCFAFTFTVGFFSMPRFAQQHARIEQGVVTRHNKRAFFQFATANLLSTLFATFTMLLIRSWVIEEHGLTFSGLFDAGWTLTFNYATIFLSACNAFYLPTLTALTKPEEQRVCIQKMAYIVLGSFVVIYFTLLLFDKWFMNLLYSAQFQPSVPVLQILAIAVIFRAVSWVYGTMILANAQSLTLLISELLLNASMLASTRYALSSSVATLESLGWAFVAPQFLYLVFSIEYACRKNSLLRRFDIWPLLLATVFPLLYLACFPSSLKGTYYYLHEALLSISGLAIIGFTWLAYKKIRL